MDLLGEKIKLKRPRPLNPYAPAGYILDHGTMKEGSGASRFCLEGLYVPIIASPDSQNMKTAETKVLSKGGVGLQNFTHKVTFSLWTHCTSGRNRPEINVV
jgi:hypothetical protein